MTSVDADRGLETGCLVYGVVPASARLPEDLRGIDGRPLALVRQGRVAAVVETVAVDRPPGRRRELLTFSSVIDELARTTTIAPVQFGSVALDESSVRTDVLAPREEEHAWLLGQLEGRLQLNLRATYLEEVVLAEVVAEDPEVARLRERTRHVPEEASYADRVRLGELVSHSVERRRDTDVAALLDWLDPLAVRMVQRPGSGMTHVLDVAMLVEADRQGDVEEQLEDLAEQVHERMGLRLVGPVAPYDFVDGALWD